MRQSVLSIVFNLRLPKSQVTLKIRLDEMPAASIDAYTESPRAGASWSTARNDQRFGATSAAAKHSVALNPNPAGTGRMGTKSRTWVASANTLEQFPEWSVPETGESKEAWTWIPPVRRHSVSSRTAASALVVELPKCELCIL